MAGTTRLEPAASAVTEIFRPEHLANFGLACSFLIPSFVGAGCAFLAGLLALRWLSAWLEQGDAGTYSVYVVFLLRPSLSVFTC
jgi:hypothetical protein